MTNVAAIRQAIVGILPPDTLAKENAPTLNNLYFPASHMKALRLESSLVIGARGVGKSFWTKALQSKDLRRLVGESISELDRAKVRIGFAEEARSSDYPDDGTFEKLLKDGVKAESIWRAVIFRWLVSECVPNVAVPRKTWKETIAWIADHPEDVARSMEAASTQFEHDNQFGLVVFDALDRTSSDWNTMDVIVRGLLQAALWLRRYPRLYAKVFLREDQYERTVKDFPDASKLISTSADLTWKAHDLHGLLWQRLLNGTGKNGELIRRLYAQVPNIPPLQPKSGIYSLSEEVKREAPYLRPLFEKLAGQWMGQDHRRGVPYKWSVGHLADGRGQTSPRSFLAAIREAAKDSLGRDYKKLPLHYESIKRGIRAASQIRVYEISEEYPWAKKLLDLLHGKNVPCKFEEFTGIWKKEFSGDLGSAFTDNELPPQHYKEGWKGIRDDLIRIGLITQKPDGRIDMPDLYRVGFGLGRKGGVRPKG